MAAARLGLPAAAPCGCLGPHQRPRRAGAPLDSSLRPSVRRARLSPSYSSLGEGAATTRTATNPSSSSSSSSSSSDLTTIGVICVSELSPPGAAGGARQAEALLAANDLVAREFYPPNPKSPVGDALAFNSYRLRHAAQNFGLHMQEGARGAHATLLAVATSSEEGSGSPNDGGASSSTGSGKQRPRRRRPGWGFLPGGGGFSSSGRGGWEGSDIGGEPVGVCNVTLRWAGDGIAAAAGCLPGAPFAMVTNMTVVPEWRRRGVARQLLESCLVTATCRLPEAPHFVALLCYRGYSPAYNLYTSFGFLPTNWMDPLWREDAERARVGKPRRLLLVKPLRTSVRPPSPPQQAQATAPAEAAAAAAATAQQSSVLER